MSSSTAGSSAGSGERFDVIVVGYGPVGQTTAALLARAGHSVAAFERHAQLYPFPRAGLADHEVMRVFQSIGCADRIAADAIVPTSYEWRDADGKVLLPLTFPSGPSGWGNAFNFYQPYLEQAIDATAREAGADVRTGQEAVALRTSDDGVELDVRDADGRVITVGARFLIGADGANSFVRRTTGAEVTDLGFRYDWIVVDLEPLRPLGLSPNPYQICDPARPTTVVPLGKRHRRFEFMLLPGEDPAQMSSPESVWQLLAPYVEPGDVRLLRHPVYTFSAKYASSWRAGPVLLAGDAAHLMPPFLGQGMCSGIRDAKNLAWKLDLVLRGVLGDAILDTYTPERRPQVEFIIRESVELGAVMCITDPEAAAARDAGLVERAAAMAANVDEPAPAPSLPPIEAGLIAGGDDALAGTLSFQGRVARAGESGRFDDVVGRGFTLIGAGLDPAEHLDADRLAFLEALGTTIAGFGIDGPRSFDDIDATYAGWLADSGVCAVLVRPDFYVYGAARTSEDLAGLVDALRRALPLPG